MLQMSGKMWTAPLPAVPLRLENAFLEVRGSPDRIRKAHSVYFRFLFLPCLAAATPPCTTQTLTPARVPYVPSPLQLPLALLYFTPGGVFQTPFVSSIYLKHWKATSEKPGSGSPQPGPAAVCPIAPSSAQLCPSAGVHGQPQPRQELQPPLPLLGFAQTSCTIQWLKSSHSNCVIAPTAFTKCQSSQNSDTWYGVSLCSFGEGSLKTSHLIPVLMIMHNKEGHS